jgi:predicted nucleotidyltransferase
LAEFEPRAIVEVLQRHGVDFVMIGGLAAFLQGSPLPTTDVDITPELTDDNRTRLSAALTELDARGRAEGTEPLPFAHDADSLARAGVWNLSTKHGDLDISFVPTGTGGYADLVRDAVEVELRGIPVKLASLADIVRSKDAASRPKDLRALPVLRELLARQTRARAERRGPAGQPDG